VPFPRSAERPPSVTAVQMLEIDRLMVQDLGISLVQMMENAGRNLARVAVHRFLGGDPRGRRVTVLAGSGGNGGGAMVCARRLAGWGARVRVYTTTEPALLRGVPRQQADILARLGLSLAPGEPPDDHAELVVDGVLGYSLDGAPRGAAARLVEWAARSGAPVLSLDLPSGLDATSGQLPGAVVRATASLTLGLSKTGLDEPAAHAWVGDLYLGDIGIPPQLYEGVGLRVPALFHASDIIRLR